MPRILLMFALCAAVIPLSAQPSSLRLLAPNGGETFSSCSPVTIRWEGNLPNEPVRLHMSSNGGASWTLITDNATGNSYDWAPSGGGNSMMIRVSSGSAARRTLGDQDALAFGTWQHPGANNPFASYIHWSPQGDRILLLNDRDDNGASVASIYNAHNGSLIRRLQVEGQTAAAEWHAATWSPDGKYIAAATGTWDMGVWDAATGQLLHPLVPDNVRTITLAWNSTGTLLMKQTEKEAQIWDPVQGILMRRFPHAQEFGKKVPHAAWAPDGEHLAVSMSGFGMVVVKVLTGDSVHLRDVPEITRLAWSPDGSTIITTMVTQDVMLWDVATRGRLWRLPLSSAPSWSPDGKRILVEKLGIILIPTVADARTGALITTTEIAGGALRAPLWANMGECIAAVRQTPDEGGVLGIWNAGSGDLHTIIKANSVSSVINYAPSPDGGRVAVLGNYGSESEVRIWTLQGCGSYDDSDNEFTVIPSSITIKEVDMGEAGAGETIDTLVQGFITNTGTIPFQISRITASGDFIIVDGDQPRTLLPGEMLAVRIRFTPTRDGAQVIPVIIESPCGNRQGSIRAKGNIPSDIDIAPESLPDKMDLSLLHK